MPKGDIRCVLTPFMKLFIGRLFLQVNLPTYY